jgi:hypothetical protein
MSIDLGNAPVGTPPTDEQKTQIRKSIAAFAPTAIGPVASFLDPDYFGIFEDGNLAIPKNIADITSLTVEDYGDDTLSGTLLLTPLTNLQNFNIQSSSDSPLNIEMTGHQSLETFALNSSITSLDFSNCTNLTSINTKYCTDPIYIFTGCTSLTDIAIGFGSNDINLTPCTALESFSLWSSNSSNINAAGLQNLTSILFYNSTLVNNLNITGCLSLTEIDCFDPVSLTSLDISDCPLLLTLNLPASYDSAAVNTILMQLDENGLEDGYVDVTSNEGPTGDGITAAANLVAKGWTVITA